MVDVVATTKGFFAGHLREPGEAFSIPDETWKNEKTRPKWVVKAGAGASVSRRDEGGNGVVEALGGPAPDWVPKEPRSDKT